jgi:hypothetical protein
VYPKVLINDKESGVVGVKKEVVCDKTLLSKKPYTEDASSFSK